MNGGPSKILPQVQRVFEEQSRKLANREAYKQILPTIKSDLERLSREFVKLNPIAGDFEFGFHAWPDSSVGHLHMHVFPKRASLRQFSTKAHDWKTIPLESVLEAERQSAT